MWAGHGDRNTRLANVDFANPVDDRYPPNRPFRFGFVGQLGHLLDRHLVVSLVDEEAGLDVACHTTCGSGEQQVRTTVITENRFQNLFIVDLIFNNFDHKKKCRLQILVRRRT